ncbi:protein kinase domain-containing protein [Umezawaea sp. Da 62-37]|uniref:serine/threonine-protein kinase n=1 Tax=Umezawaea sp. Da 62-37 TaxID=3075927 RepID=UPI0028F6FE63|nr:protein kinase [Umezawaea sp. Da 62-37]WNV87397.1 protein kinase [Umezawaea sp. Da 62-37]
MPQPVNDELLAGRYELADIIGIGGVATVHRAWDTRLHRPVAIKLFAAGDDLANTQRFDNEVRVLAGLHHPGLVTVHDTGTTTDGKPFVVLRLIDGPTLRHHMTDGPLPVDEIRSLGAAVADALSHVHDHGVVHRDVKPSNILLDHDGTPHLADFGLAHSVGSTRLTRTGLIVGTAAYLAPEQVRGADVDSPTDIYSLGLVLLECLTGHCEYTGTDIETIVSRLHRSPIIPDHLPTDLARLLTLMTAQSPRDRPTAHQCADALRTGQTTAVSAIPPAATRKRALIAAAGLFTAIGIAWAVAPGPTTPVSEPPDAAKPALVQASTPTTSTTQEAAAQLVAATSTSATTEQQPPNMAEPAPVPQQEPQQVQAEEPQPRPGVEPAPHGPGKDDKPVPPGQLKKGKP